MTRGPRNDKRTWVVESLRDQNSDPGMMDVIKMIGAFTNCLKSFTRRVLMDKHYNMSMH